MNSALPRHPLNAIVDRPREEAAVAVAAAWLAFMASIVAGGDVEDAASFAVEYTLAGAPLGWMFWRWGLPYAILCHIAANAAHLAFQQGLF